MTDTIDAAGLLNWVRVDERLTTSGQPSTAQLAALAAAGVRTVVNLGLHTHEHALPDETGDLARLGVAYVHLPVVFAAPTTADFERFVREMERLAGERVHVHCIMNWRVSAFVCRWRTERLGWAVARARAEMLQVWTPDAVWERFLRGEEPAG